jgi:hypothetical protein
MHRLPFSCIHPTHPCENRRRMRRWGIDGGAPAPPPEPPLDAELLVRLPVVVLGVAPVLLQYVGSWAQT